jgi:hypothetical protein
MGQIFLSPRRLYEFPNFIAFTFGIVLLPQAFSLYLSETVSDQQKSDLFCMCFLCVAAAFIGYQIQPRRFALPELLNRRPGESQIFWGALLLVVVGSVFDILLASLPEGTPWDTGVATIYLFFVGFMQIGFGISFYAALRYRHPKFWAVAILGSSSSIINAVFQGRRENTALFLMLIASSFFFVRGRCVPRAVIALGMFLAMAIVPIIGQYRAAAAVDPLHAYKSLDLTEAAHAFKEGNLHPEMIAALWRISDTKEADAYAWGGGYWDELVFRFVPAQIVGMDLKKSLFIGNRIKEYDAAQMYARGYPLGTTITAAGDLFEQFGFFGALVFAVMGYFFRGFWELAIRTDAIFVHVLYASAAITAMHCVTHGTVDFLPGLIYTLLAIGLIQFSLPVAASVTGHRMIRA